jgi:divalent metal cation (Fe/Co/Zn/Cd) transporter
MAEEQDESTEEKIEDIVLTKKRFSKMIDDYVQDHPDSTYMDAVLQVCEERVIDPMDVGKLISPVIREKIEAEAMSANLVKGGGNSLPI